MAPLADGHALAPGAPAPYPGRLAASLAVLAAFGLVVGALTWHGRRGRVVAEGSDVLTVASPEQAAALLRMAGVRGRTLLLFDAVPRFRRLYEEATRGAAPGPDDWVEFSVFDNVVRRAFVVLPEAEWPAFRARASAFRPLREVPASPAPTPLFTASGIALVVVTPGCLPALDEPALVYVDARRHRPAEVAALLDRRGVRRDVTIVHRPEGAP